MGKEELISGEIVRKVWIVSIVWIILSGAATALGQGKTVKITLPGDLSAPVLPRSSVKYSDLLKQLQDSGHGETANSWVGGGPNKAISPSDLGSALGADQINQLSAQSGISRDDLLSGLSRYLPQVIDHLTPDGRLPNEDELSGRL